MAKLEDPEACDPVPIRKGEDATVGCARAVILQDRAAIDHCPGEFRATPEGLMFQEAPYHVMLVTWGETVHEHCPGCDDHASFGLGTHQVEGDGTCFLTTESWSLLVVQKG